MSPNDNPNLAIPANQKLKTPLKASVVILTSFILAACGTSGKSQSYNLSDITPIVGDGITKDKYEEEKKKAEDAKKEAEEALKAKEEAEKAKEEALKAKEEAEKAKEEAEKALEDALAGGGNKAELEKIAEEKAKEAETAQNVAEEKAKQAQEALQAAEIKNAPESTKTGVQHINIDASGLGQGELTTTTRDFKVTDKTQVDARADIASGGLVSDPVALKVSGDSDAEVDGSNGFKSFSNTTKVVTSSLGEQDLIYTSTYKDYGDDLRVAHIDGKAAGLLPVNGVAAVGNATKADNVPTEGKVGYTGDATYRKAGDNLIEYGKSVFNVDFVAKNLTGDLTFSDKKIGLQAAIDGNKFSGSKDGYNADGGFYGGDAQYLGGVYEGNGAQGTYGAKSDKQAAADKVAADAKAAADDAKAAAEKAKQEAERAKKRAENAGSGDGEALAEAEARADAAEEAAKAAEEAKLAAEKALKAAEEAANKAVGDAKAEADAAVAEANKKLEDAEKAADAAKTKRDELQSDLDKANQEAAEQKAKADAAQKEAADAKAELDKFKAELAKVKAELEKAKQDLEDALASGSGNTDYLEAQVERRQNELKDAQAAVEASEQEVANAQQRVEQEAQAAAAAQQAADEAIQAAQIKNDAQATKTGVQHISIDARGLNQGLLVATTRDFNINSLSEVDARADTASGGLVSDPVTLQVSSDSDSDVADSNGFKSFENTTKVQTASLGEQDLAYTSTYKDFSDELRVAHIDGAAAGLLPVNGVAVVGNATESANVPTEGKVGYSGDATYRALGKDSQIKFGTSDFTADFVAKNLTGDLTFSDTKIGLAADINGNQFSGSKDGYNTDGGFYGGDGQYIGGVYEGNDAQGTFAAKSDQLTEAEQAVDGAKAKAEAAQKALAAEQAKADEAKAAAEQAKADAAEAQEALDAAKKALENAGEGSNEQALKDALEKAQAEADKAKADAEAAIKEAKENAQQEVAAAQEQAKTAEQQAKTAQEQATDAKEAEAQAIAEKEAAEKEAAERIAAVESAADEDIADAKKLADEAQAKAKAAQDKAAQAETDRLAAEAAAKEAETAKAAAEAAKKAADDRIKELEAELEALKNPDAYKSEAEADKSGVQHLSVDASGLEMGVKTTTSRDFTIRSTSDVDARADLALTGVIQAPIAIQVSGDNDAETSNGFKAYEGKGTVLSEGDLGYTSIYKDFGDNGELRIAHIDGAAVDGNVPVNGVVALGNKTVTLPTEGEAKYAGDATNRKVGVDGQVEYGSSEFTADFVAKSIDGTLKFKQAGEIALSADIDGNEFSGSAADNDGYNTEGAFYGEDAKYVGGIYEGNGSQGTYGATKDGTPADLVEPTPENPEVPADSEMTGFQSTTLSSKEQTVAGIQLDNAIGYVKIYDDASDFESPYSGTEAGDVSDEQALKDPNIEDKDGSLIPVDNRKGNNFTNFTNGVVRADMVKPGSVFERLDVSLRDKGKVTVDAGKGDFINPKFEYTPVYKNFNDQMQTGHVYGDFISLLGPVSRAANVYVQGYLTDQKDIDYLKQVNDGKAQYAGSATYIENIHLSDTETFAPYNGSSNFDVDFVNNSVKGELAFDGDFKYNSTGKIGIEATIDGNTFAGNVNGIDTAGGFYGEDAQFLGGIYQDASVEGGKGTTPGTGTKFQGTFGAEMQQPE